MCMHVRFEKTHTVAHAALQQWQNWFSLCTHHAAWGIDLTTVFVCSSEIELLNTMPILCSIPSMNTAWGLGVYGWCIFNRWIPYIPSPSSALWGVTVKQDSLKHALPASCKALCVWSTCVTTKSLIQTTSRSSLFSFYPCSFVTNNEWKLLVAMSMIWDMDIKPRLCVKSYASVKQSTNVPII